MIVAEIYIEPSEHLWPLVPIFLLAVLVADVTLARPRGAVLSRWSRRRRWIAALVAVGGGSALIWGAPGVGPQARWWCPAWTLVLFWGIAAREAPTVAGWLGMPRLRMVIRFACAVGAGLSLLALSRSDAPDDPSLLAWSLIGLVVLTLVWSGRSYRQPATRQQGPQRLPLLLRILAVCLLAVLLLNPVERYTQVRYDRACLLVLLDDSRSMGIRDVVSARGGQPVSRAGALNTALAAHEYEFRRIARELDLVRYWFTDRLVAAEGMNVRAQGDYTALGDVIQQAYEAGLHSRRPIAGVLVCTDGASNLTSVAEPSAAAAALAAGHVPLWAVGVGSETPTGQTRTILPRNLLMARRVAAMNQLPVVAEFSFVGLQAQPVRVELLFDDDVVDHRRIECTKIRETRQIRFTFVPQVGGLHRVTVRALPERFTPDGPVPALSQYLHVTDEVIRVLYIEGKPRYESTFVFRALATSQQIRLRKALLAEPKDDQLRSLTGGAVGEWQWYHVLILGDMAPGQLTSARMALIQRHVGDNGCGLAVLGTRGFIGEGEPAGTPLAKLLPFDANAGWIDQPVTVLPTDAGRRHAVCKIAESTDDVSRRWRELPPMRGACRFGQPKPAAQILAVSGSGEPMIIGHHYGAGRVLGLAFDSTWQWCMLMDDGAQYHRRFWRQVVLWLANRRPAVWIAADRPRYQLPLLRQGRQRVEIQAGVDSPIKDQTIDDVQLEARMILPGGESEPVTMTAGDDHYAAAVEPTSDGTYKLELVVRSRDQEIGRSAGQFVVESPDLEMAGQLADFDLLREMSARTHPAGGKFVTLDGLSAVLRQIGTHDYRRRHEETITSELTDEGRWHLWTIFCGLLLAEWVIRKRRGLV